jgi:hypothetical protein
LIAPRGLGLKNIPNKAEVYWSFQQQEISPFPSYSLHWKN